MGALCSIARGDSTSWCTLKLTKAMASWDIHGRYVSTHANPADWLTRMEKMDRIHELLQVEFTKMKFPSNAVRIALFGGKAKRGRVVERAVSEVDSATCPVRAPEHSL